MPFIIFIHFWNIVLSSKFNYFCLISIHLEFILQMLTLAMVPLIFVARWTEESYNHESLAKKCYNTQVDCMTLLSGYVYIVKSNKLSTDPWWYSVLDFNYNTLGTFRHFRMIPEKP